MSAINQKTEKVLTKKTGIFTRIIRNYDLLLLMLPGFVSMIIFSYVPMYGILLAFKDFRMLDGIMGSPWVGFKYFQEMFTMPDFFNVLRNTLGISLIKLFWGFPAPIILALMLNELRSIKFKKVVQNFTYLPYFFSWVVLGGIVRMLFSADGPVNMFIMAMGGERLEFFADGGLFIGLIVGTSIWQSIGWNSIIFLSAISGIDESLYEAANIDGAGRWKQAIHITLPSLIPTIITVFILNLGGILNAGFDQIYNLYNPVVYEAADIIDTYVFRKFEQTDYSFGTAVGLFKSVVGLILVVITNWFVKKLTNDEQGIF